MYDVQVYVTSSKGSPDDTSDGFDPILHVILGVCHEQESLMAESRSVLLSWTAYGDREGKKQINHLIDTDSIQSVRVPRHFKWQINTKTWIILLIYAIANAICRHMKKTLHNYMWGIIKNTLLILLHNITHVSDWTAIMLKM